MICDTDNEPRNHEGGNSAANVTGQSLHFFQRNHVDLSIPCLLCQRLEVQLLVCGNYRQTDSVPVALDGERLEDLLWW